MADKPTRVEYVCTWCGSKSTRSASAGRPMPGNCARKPKDSNGRPKPHTWVINRKF